MTDPDISAPERAPDEPVSVGLLLECIDLDLPDGYRIAGTQPVVPSLVELEKAIRLGRSIQVALDGLPRYGHSSGHGLTHIVKNARGYLRNASPDMVWAGPEEWEERYRIRPSHEEAPAQQRGPHPDSVPWSQLAFDIRFSATWACGNTTNQADLVIEPGTRKCPACFGLPRPPRAQRYRPPSVRALPEATGRCLAQELLPGRACRTTATWKWGHTPVCLRHLGALRDAWVTGPGDRRAAT